MSTYGELAREMEAEDLLEAAPSWPWPFSAGGSLLLEAAAEDMVLRPGPPCPAAPAPPSILPPRAAHRGKARGLRSATALIRRRGAGGGVRVPASSPESGAPTGWGPGEWGRRRPETEAKVAACG